MLVVRSPAGARDRFLLCLQVEDLGLIRDLYFEATQTRDNLRWTNVGAALQCSCLQRSDLGRYLEAEIERAEQAEHLSTVHSCVAAVACQAKQL